MRKREKRNVTKLQLSRETLRQLQDSEVLRAQGGSSHDTAYEYCHDPR